MSQRAASTFLPELDGGNLIDFHRRADAGEAARRWPLVAKRVGVKPPVVSAEIVEFRPAPAEPAAPKPARAVQGEAVRIPLDALRARILSRSVTPLEPNQEAGASPEAA